MLCLKELNMARCDTCEKYYHMCPSCAEEDWSYDFCSSECYRKENPEAPETFTEMVKRINSKRRFRKVDTSKRLERARRKLGFEEPSEEQLEMNRLLLELYT
jgi:hypothetical protein